MTETLTNDNIRLHCNLCGKAQGYEPDYFSCPCSYLCARDFCLDCCLKMERLSKDEICPFCLYEEFDQLTAQDEKYLVDMGFFKQEKACEECATTVEEDSDGYDTDGDFFCKDCRDNRTHWVMCHKKSEKRREPISSPSSSQPQALSSEPQPSSEK